MPMFRCEMKFAASPYGWTESLYRVESTPAAALEAILDLAQTRWKILGAGARLYRVRVSQVGFPRASVTALNPGRPVPTSAMLGLEGADVRLSAGSGGLYKRNYFLRGLPAGSLTNASGRWQFAPQWAGPIRYWLDKLVSGGWLMQAWGRAGPRYPIMGLFGFPAEFPEADFPPPDGLGQFVPPGTVIAAVAGLPVLPDPNAFTNASPTIRIGGVKWSDPIPPGPAKVNGEFIPVAINTNQVQYWADLPSVGQYVSGGYLQVRPRIYPPINRWELVRHAVHATGPAPKEETVNVPPLNQEVQLAVFQGQLARSASTELGSLARAMQIRSAPQPPTPPTPPPIPPVSPVHVTWSSAQDVILTIQGELNLPVPPVDYKPIGLYQVLNLPNTWAVLCSGSYWSQDKSATDEIAAISLGTGLMTEFVNNTLRLFGINIIPKGSDVYFYGFSQGGMVVEYVAAYVQSDFADDYTVKGVMTFAAPMVLPFYPRTYPVVRFRITGDLVPVMGPFAVLQAYLGFPAYTVIPQNPAIRKPSEQHGKMAFNPALDRYSVLGAPSQHTPQFQVGFGQFFAAPKG